MAVNIPTPPVQANPPASINGRVTVDSTLRVTNGPLDTLIEYEVQEHHAALGYRITEGRSRTEVLPNGTNTPRHWFVLEGPDTLIIVDCRIRVTGQGSQPKTAGFAVEVS